jgi:hypothetical protein
MGVGPGGRGPRLKSRGYRRFIGNVMASGDFGTVFGGGLAGRELSAVTPSGVAPLQLLMHYVIMAY